MGRLVIDRTSACRLDDSSALQHSVSRDDGGSGHSYRVTCMTEPLIG